MPKMFKKVIISGHVIEVYDYEEPVFYGFKSKGGRKKDEPEDVPCEVEDVLSKYETWDDLEEGSNLENEDQPPLEENRKKEYRKTAMYRARERLRRLILCNFNQYSKFVTLTFRDGEVRDLKDVTQTNPLFTKFIMRLKYYLKKNADEAIKNKTFDLKYAAVIEFQDKNGRGAVHYHMICNLPWLPHKELEKLWGHGWVGINSLRAKMREDGKDVDNVGAYMIKYMIKNFNDDRLAGKKAYFTSRNLEKPKELKGMEAEAFWHLRKMEEKEIVFTSSYESEHFGTIQYREYNLKRGTGNTPLQNEN